MSIEQAKLPSMEHTFSVSLDGDETKKHYEGTFTYRRPNLLKRAEISKMCTRLSGDLQNLPLATRLFNEMCAVLFYCLDEAPNWWEGSNNGRDLYDINVLQNVYNQCMEFEETWSKKVWGEKKKDVTKEKKKE